MIKTALGFGQGAKTTQLQSAGYYKDNGEMDKVTEGSGNLRRQLLFSESKLVEFEAPLHVDFYNQEIFLLNNIPFRQKMYRARTPFVLLSEETENEYKLVIEDIVMRMLYVRPSPGVILGHNKVLKIAPALYPFTRCLIQTHTLASGLGSFSIDGLFNNVRLDLVVVAMLSGKAFNADIRSNSFYYRPFDLREIALYVNDESIGGRPMKIESDDQGRQTMIPFVNIYVAIVRLDEDSGLYLERGDFENHAFFVFPLSVQLQNTDHSQLIKHGNLLLEGRFNQAIGETITIIIYAEFASLLEVDLSRKIKLHQP